MARGCGKRSVAESTGSAERAQFGATFGMGELWRVAIWGLAAATALSVAAFASTTTVGTDRLMQAAGQLQEVIRPTANKPLRPLNAREGQRLAESIQTLAEDRERLHARIGALEQSIDNVTGSLARMSKTLEAAVERPASAAAEQTAPAAAAPAPVSSSTPAAAPTPTQTSQTPAPTPTAAPSADVPPLEDSTASVNAAVGQQAPVRVPVPRSPPAPDPQAKAEFGLDIGGGVSIEGLRALWSKARQQHAPMLEGLRPVVHLRESRRSGGIELRLVAGPLPSAAAAARLCATLNAAGTPCRPAVYDGQRLAAR